MANYKLKLKKGDMVKVLSGKDKGKTGKILSVIPPIGKAVVEGVWLRTRHEKTKPGGKAGGKVTSPSPIYISKLQLIDPHSGKPTRVGLASLDGGAKQRIAKKSGKAI